MSDTTPPESPRPFNPLAVWIPIILIVLGGVVLYNYLWAQKLRQTSEIRDRPAYLGRLERDLTLTERSGNAVKLSDLRGKILIASWVFTRCPRGCAGVIAKLKILHQELANTPDVHLLSFTLDPEDTPEMMKKFADGLGIAPSDQWWFLNGNKDAVRDYMTSAFKFNAVRDLPEADRLSPDDKYIHDLRVAVVDHQGHLRGLYDVMNADPDAQTFWDAKLRRDLQYLLREKHSGKAGPVPGPRQTDTAPSSEAPNVPTTPDPQKK